jgi:hypothetical protein
MPALQAWNNGVIFTRRELRGGCFFVWHFAPKVRVNVVEIYILTTSE